MDWMQKFLNTNAGKVVVVLAVLAGGWAFYVQLHNSFGNAVVAAVNSRPFIDSETGVGFWHELKAGEPIPVVSPDTGKNTGFPAELCYWNKDGSVKTDPTFVLLNSWSGKSGPTFCPDCGRLVVFQNPKPGPDSRPPPTQAEMRQAR
jgi:hypothetical protein